MSSQHTPHNPVSPGGGRATASPPQVVVRAGKTYACTACGTLVEIPAEVVGQLVAVPEKTARKEITERSPEREQPASEMCASAESSEERRSTQNVRRCQPTRRIQPAQVLPERERIDGLIVPTAQEMERLLGWIEYRLQRLKFLQQLEKQLTRQSSEQVPVRRLGRPTKRVPTRPRNGLRRRHAHADVSMAPETNEAHQRGPP